MESSILQIINKTKKSEHKKKPLVPYSSSNKDTDLATLHRRIKKKVYKHKLEKSDGRRLTEWRTSDPHR